MEKSLKIAEDVLKTVSRDHKYGNSKITIKQITSGGANYSSYIFSAVISSPIKDDLKLFIKVAAMGPKIREIADNIYRNEIYFYTDFIKLYRDLEEKHSIPIDRRLRTAKYFGGSEKIGYESLVLQDLSENGFQSFDRFKSVTWEQTAECMRQLAQFHVLSIALSKEKPEEYEMTKSRFSFASTKQFLVDMIESIRDRVVEATEQRNKQRIKNFIQNTLDSENFNYFFTSIRKEVLIHGDFRPNNLMYKIHNGVCEIVTLDFQTLHCGSPAYDILYFINFGSDNEFRKQYYQASLDFYYSEFSASLRRLKMDPNEEYSRQDFDYEIKEILPYAVLFGLCGLLIITVDEDSAPKELGNLGPKDFSFTPSEHFRQRLNDFIEFYTDLGVIP